MTNSYDLISENPESTVVAEFEPGIRSAAQYQSEAEMEKDFIRMLTNQAYEYLPIHAEADLLTNLRTQIQNLNYITFEDDEWNQFLKTHITNPNFGIIEKTTIIQEDHRIAWTRPDGSIVNICLIDKENIHNNSMQVINQYVPEGGIRDNRYDVTILVNGLPLVHVELKRRGVEVKEAFNQINRYQRESFWAGCGLFEFVQIFIISNGTLTKYYSNTTRAAHLREHAGHKHNTGKRQTSNSFEFTNYWARFDNEPILDLVDFTRTFLSKHTLLAVLTKYCVFTVDRILLVMRPYQIAATEKILKKIEISSNAKEWGSTKGGGYIWHTTGSGKTLTSFKTARIASKMPDIEKVFFVVDRKDLDYQTMKEYDKFEKGAADSNSSTAALTKQINSADSKIIITTIQKLSNFISRNPKHAVYGKHVVLIFDECHRSQFGDMHKAIVKKFKKYHMFGFTGTPIFPENAGSIRNVEFTTTEGAFGDRLHTYTIVDAIRDGNVLPFRTEYISTMREQEKIPEEQVANIDRERALMAPQRIEIITDYIIRHFAQKTKRNSKVYDFNKVTNIGEVASGKNREDVKEKKQTVKMTGFNSILAVQSIPFAKLYYEEFKRQMADYPSDKRLKIATIYSYGANDEIDCIGIPDDENSENTDGLSGSDRDFLEKCIHDYNEMFGTSYDTSSDKFQSYYKDLSMRVKNQEIDLLIVVNMFLTGFDATTLNTLWVDKNLRMHGLLQAYSRTNRILNSIKNCGNIVCFRNLEPATNACLALFGNKNAKGTILLRSFDDYYNGYTDEEYKYHEGYVTLIGKLMDEFPLDKTILGEKAEKEFIRQFGTILRALNILTAFDQFEGSEIMSAEQLMDYKSIYLNLHDKYRHTEAGESVDIVDDIVFEIELVKSVDINIDYILFLIGKYRQEAETNAEIVLKIKKNISSSPELRDKEELILNFIGQLTPDANVEDEWRSYVVDNMKAEAMAMIEAENLRMKQTIEFLIQSFRDGEIKESGTSIVNLLPAMGLFGAAGTRRAEKKKRVTALLKEYFRKYYEISGGVFPTE